MEKWHKLFTESAFRFFDHTETQELGGRPNTAMASFAADDALALSVTGGDLPAMRLWVHDKTIVLGIPDTRLPYLEQGLALARSQGYGVIVRNSGGLAVVLDKGVLNLSLILPGVKHLSIYECYDAMVFFVRHMLKDLTDSVEAYEIIGSYCPGDYDLSIGGRKFAGISQRRVKEGAAIQIYLDVTGNSQERAELIRRFYKRGVQDSPVKSPPPEVVPATMASLSELLGVELSVADMKARALATLSALSPGVVASIFTEQESADFEKRYAQMIKRNEDIT